MDWMLRARWSSVELTGDRVGKPTRESVLREDSGVVVAESEARAPQQARAVERRELLLRAATRVFAERGFGRAGMDEVARAAETSKGGLYFHFPTKQALLAAVVSRAGALLQRRVRAAMERAGDDPLARADAALAALFVGLSGRRALARVLNEALAAGPEIRAQAAQIEDEFAALLRPELERALALGRIAPLDPELAARAWVAMAQGMIGAWADGRIRAQPQRMQAEIRRLALRGAGVEDGIEQDLKQTEPEHAEEQS